MITYTFFSIDPEKNKSRFWVTKRTLYWMEGWCKLMIDSPHVSCLLTYRIWIEMLAPAALLASKDLPARPFCGVRIVGMAENEVVEVKFFRRRPLHPERFVEKLRQRFGPLDRDGWNVQMGKVPRSMDQVREVEVLAGSGCVWFMGSDDIQAEWFYSEGRHLLRCGEPWPLSGAGAAGARRVELVVRVMGTALAIQSWKEEFFSELGSCLITREEVDALEQGNIMLNPQCEWEEIRAAHQNMSFWVLRWWHALLFLNTITRLVSTLPGFTKLQATGRSLANRVQTCGRRRVTNAKPSYYARLHDLMGRPMSQTASYTMINTQYDWTLLRLFSLLLWFKRCDEVYSLLADVQVCRFQDASPTTPCVDGSCCEEVWRKKAVSPSIVCTFGCFCGNGIDRTPSKHRVIWLHVCCNSRESSRFRFIHALVWTPHHNWKRRCFPWVPSAWRWQRTLGHWWL